MSNEPPAESVRPRITPLPESERTEHVSRLLEALGRNKDLNIFSTMARAPEAFEAFTVWGNYVLSSKSSLQSRDRELAILRTGHRCEAEYEIFQHEQVGRYCGLTDAEIQSLREGSDPSEWPSKDAAILVACDQLHDTSTLDDKAWTDLLEHFSERQCMDLVFAIGQYTMVSMLLNSFGVQIE